MQRMSKAFYLGSFIGATIVMIMIIVFGIIAIAIAAPNVADFKTPAIIGLVFLIMLLIAIVLYIVVVTVMMHYKMWNAINDEEMPIHPVLAVALLIIPIVSFFWLFAVYPLYVKFYNEYIERQAVGVEAIKPGLFYAYPALLGIYLVFTIFAQIGLFLNGGTPVVIFFMMLNLIGSVASLTSFVVFLFLISKICDAVNVLPLPTMERVINSAR